MKISVKMERNGPTYAELIAQIQKAKEEGDARSVHFHHILINMIEAREMKKLLERINNNMNNTELTNLTRYLKSKQEQLTDELLEYDVVCQRTE